MNILSLKKVTTILSGIIVSICSCATFAVQLETAYTSYSRFDEHGLLLGTISANSGAGYLATRNSYDAVGRLEKVENGNLSTWQDDTVKPATWSGFTVFSSQVFAYDSYGRKASVTVLDKNNAAISLTQINYDSQSRVLCQTVRMNPAVYASLPDACSQSTLGPDGPDRITKYTYNEFDQPLTITKALGTTLVQTYVKNTYSGRELASQTDANGNRTELRYDANGRLERMVFPSTTTKNSVNENDYVHFEYDANGNKTAERKRNGAWVYYYPDANNRVIRKDYADNSKQADVYYDYDARGLLLSSRFNSTTGVGITNTFDGFGRLSTTTTNQGVSHTLTTHYDDNNNRTQLIHPDGKLFTYSFDQLNRVTGVADTAIANNNVLTVNYQANGHRGSIVRNGGAAASTTYTFANGVQLNNFQQSFANSANNLSNSFSFNQAGQIKTLTLSNTSYVYSGNDNRTGIYLVDGLNRYTSIAGQPLGYDGNSNLTNDGSQTYTYDDENRLLTSSSANATGSFVYDPNGRLFQVTINGVARQFLYDGDALVAEYSTSGTLLKRYVHGDQVDEPWVQYNGTSVTASNRRYLHSDHQGSIIAHSDTAGNIALQPNGTPAKFAYDGFGIPLANNSDTFGYTGQVYFKELGLNYYKARFYSPKLGRFLQTDPIGYKDDMDLYAYVGNDPVNHADPSGLCIEDACVGEAALVVMGAEALADTAIGAEVIAESSAMAGEVATAYRGSELARNMEAAGNAVEKGVEHAHHIVAQGAKAAKDARAVLNRVGVKIHDAANGARMKIANHLRTHTKEYYERVNKAVGDAEKSAKGDLEKAKAAVEKTLDNLRKELQK